MDEQKVLSEPFSVSIHKATFINYLEVILLEDGTIVYAVPSHQEKLISLACQKRAVSREALHALCPKAYYFDIMTWLCQVSGAVSVWNEHMVGAPNPKQTASLKMLQQEGLYHGPLSLHP